MLKITELGGRESYLNIDLIERISGGADTLISLLNGTNIIAKERPEELIERIVEFKRRCNDKCSIEILHRAEELDQKPNQQEKTI